MMTTFTSSVMTIHLWWWKAPGQTGWSSDPEQTKLLFFGPNWYFQGPTFYFLGKLVIFRENLLFSIVWNVLIFLFLSFLASLVHQWIKEARVAFDGRKFFVRCFCLPFLHCVLKLFLTEGSSYSIAFSNSFSSRHFTQKDYTSEGRLYNREKILLEKGPMRSTAVQVVCNSSHLLFLFQMAIPFNLCDVFNLLAPQGALRGPAFHTGSSQSVHPLIAFECIAVMVFFGWLVGPTSLRFFLFPPDGQFFSPDDQCTFNLFGWLGISSTNYPPV